MPAVEFRKVDIVFGKKTPEAVSLIDSGATRDEIIVRTGCVLGAAGIDLSVQRGEICVLMGLSGSGKSTILRAVNRLNKITRGAVLVEHAGQLVDVSSCDDKILRDLRLRTVSTVFQQFALLPWRTVRQNVEFGLEIRGMPQAERKAVVDEKLEMVGLSKWANKFANELSGGMQQRVGLARAFATDADILLMDEPFSALDPLIRGKLQDELLELQARLHKTILFVSHDLDEALKIGNRIAILEGGRIVQFGTAEDILLRPADAYVEEFVKHMNPLNVLRGHSVMRPGESLSQDGSMLLIDGYGQVRLELDSERRPIRVMRGDADCRMAHYAEDKAAAPIEWGDVIVAPAEMKLRAAISLKRQTPHPIVLVDQMGRLAGLCGDEEIYRALLRKQ